MTDALKLLSRTPWEKMGDYLGFKKLGRRHVVVDAESLRKFITSRASHVSQTSLYGYLKTRAGTRFPELFEHPRMLESINIAKWHVWLACVSDLTVFSGAILCRSGALDGESTGKLMRGVAEEILGDTGIPPDAGGEFGEARNRYQERIRGVLWERLVDDDTMFTESPPALVQWAPIVDELKRMDEEIVLNSVRFRWIEVRRIARKLLDPVSIAASVSGGGQQAEGG